MINLYAHQTIIILFRMPNEYKVVQTHTNSFICAHSKISAQTSVLRLRFYSTGREKLNCAKKNLKWQFVVEQRPKKTGANEKTTQKLLSIVYGFGRHMKLMRFYVKLHVWSLSVCVHLVHFSWFYVVSDIAHDLHFPTNFGQCALTTHSRNKPQKNNLATLKTFLSFHASII